MTDPADREGLVMTLAEFLLARIAEDEAVAAMRQERAAAIPAHEVAPESAMQATYGHTHFVANPTSPARVLAECEAKRRLVSLFATTLADEMDADVGKWNEAAWKGTQALRDIALPYADHPDYQQEWRR